jgi:hypothetical protein
MPYHSSALYREPSRDRAEQRPLRWFTAIAEHEIPELVRLDRTLDAWRSVLLAYFDTGGGFRQALSSAGAPRALRLVRRHGG